MVKERINGVLRSRKRGYALIILNILLGLACVSFTFYLTKEVSSLKVNFISVELWALMAGLIFESYRISKNWETFLVKVFTSYLLSFLVFASDQVSSANYVASRLFLWPYYIIFFFVLITVMANTEKVTAKLTEGVTLLLSVSAVYWVIDHRLVDINSFWGVTLLCVIGICTFVSFLHAFTKIDLSKGSRLFLSVWSTLILFSIACENIVNVFSNRSITASTNFLEGFSIEIQYFLLGMSSIYIMQNFLLLSQFLPSKGGRYKETLRESVKSHVERFSKQQVLIKDSFFCVIYASFFYTLNFYTKLLPRNTMIWLMLFTFPIVLEISKRIKTLRKTMAKESLC